MCFTEVQYLADCTGKMRSASSPYRFLKIGCEFCREANLSELFFTDTPDQESGYEVGDRVEVYCDHDNEKGERVRGWLTGVAVQVDAKMIAVQFRENVYLTDGWMVPDHVLWCPKDSKQMRPYNSKRRVKRK